MTKAKCTHCCKALPVSPQHFFHLFLNVHPLAELVDYAIQFKFQARGSPHAHHPLDQECTKVEEVHSFIDQYISCTVPENEDLAQS